MNEWIAVDTAEINKEVAEDIQGVTVKVSYSPYDVPFKWRGGHEEGNPHFFIIEFQYAVDEELTHVEQPVDNLPVELIVGDNDRRIYKVRIDLEKCMSNRYRVEMRPTDEKTRPADVIKDAALEAIRKYRDTVPIKLQARYKMQENLISKNGKEVLAGVGT
jgi:hypothetical protein